MPAVISARSLLEEYAITGSQAAFDQIVAQHGSLVYASILRRVRNPGLAEDATQAVFLVLAQKAPALAPQTPLASWLLTAARYAAIDALRKESRHTRHERLASAQRPEAAAPSAPAEDPRLAAIDDALLSLTTADREALVLRYHQNAPYANIAIALGTTPEAARKRLNRALIRLRKLLRSRGIPVTAGLLAALLLSATVSACAAAPIVLSAQSAHELSRMRSAAERIARAILRARLRLLVALTSAGAIAAIVLLFLGIASPATEPATSGSSAKPELVILPPALTPAAEKSAHAAAVQEGSLTLAPPVHSAFFVALVNLQSPPLADADDLQPQAADPVTCLILGITSPEPSDARVPAFDCQLSLTPQLVLMGRETQVPAVVPSFVLPFAFGPSAPTGDLRPLLACEAMHDAPASSEPARGGRPSITILAVVTLPRFPRF